MCRHRQYNLKECARHKHRTNGINSINGTSTQTAQHGTRLTENWFESLTVVLPSLSWENISMKIWIWRYCHSPRVIQAFTIRLLQSVCKFLSIFYAISSTDLLAFLLLLTTNKIDNRNILNSDDPTWNRSLTSFRHAYNFSTEWLCFVPKPRGNSFKAKVTREQESSRQVGMNKLIFSFFKRGH